MNLSSGRLALLQSALSAWNDLGFPLIKVYQKEIFPLEVGIGDDLGLFYFVPYLAKIFTFSIEQALWCWDISIAVLGIVIAVTGFWQLTKTWLEKGIVTIGVIGMGFITVIIGNLYAIPFFAHSFWPWFFVFLQKKSKKMLWGYFFVIGCSIAFCHSIRLYAGLTIGVASLIALIMYSKKLSQLVICSFCMIVGCSLYATWFRSELSRRDVYLYSQGYSKGAHKEQHVFWHTIYVGLGFITNDLGIYFGDRCADTVTKRHSGLVYCSTDYDQVLKKEVITLCKKHPLFIIRGLFAKAGVLFFYLLAFANIGLICAWFYRKPWYLECSYWAALVIGALPGLATIPIANYLVGFFTVATFYGIHSTIWALQQGILNDLRMFLRRLFQK